ncbi:MAG: hypothetical protein S4CHLAM2_16430 [Chlamydiales bacterium]|nr:hypothetical protein [Chlamydiales bacterium]
MRYALLILLFSGALFGAPQRESLAVQELRLNLDQVGYQLNGHQTEIDLFQERMVKLERAIDKLSQGTKDRSLENRLTQIEKANETLAADLKSLKGHLNQTNSTLASCQTKLTQIDKQLTSDVKGLKKSLESMLALLQKGATSSDSSIYVVKPGDSLGQIALNHKTDIKTLKKLNNLSTDKIFVGQKISLP